eukprot:8333448-Pyramimonas_sp.AAC.1
MLLGGILLGSINRKQSRGVLKVQGQLAAHSSRAEWTASDWSVRDADSVPDRWDNRDRQQRSISRIGMSTAYD